MKMKTKTPKKKPAVKETESKPLVKKFYDTEAEIVKYIKLMLPYVPQTIMHIKFLHKTNGDYRYRINYMNSEGRIPVSKYISIVVKEKDQFEIIYL